MVSSVIVLKVSDNPTGKSKKRKRIKYKNWKQRQNNNNKKKTYQDFPGNWVVKTLFSTWPHKEDSPQQGPLVQSPHVPSHGQKKQRKAIPTYKQCDCLGVANQSWREAPSPFPVILHSCLSVTKFSLLSHTPYIFKPQHFFAVDPPFCKTLSLLVH